MENSNDTNENRTHNHEINNDNKKSVHINSVHVEETILEKLFTISNKSKDRLSKRTNVEHLAWPKSTYHISHN
jgi:hypothetical protein